MELQNSRVYLDLLLACHGDVASSAQVPNIERQRDRETIKSRFHAEGLSFLTKTLPLLEKALVRALSGKDCLQHQGWKACKGARVPAFCGWLFKQVFDANGYVRSDADPEALGSLRQILTLVYKLQLPFEEEKVTETISTFVATNEEIAEKPFLDNRSGSILSNARAIVRRITQELDLANIKPKHGPGVVSTGQQQHEKKFFGRIIEKLEKKYPLCEYFFFSPTHLSDAMHLLPNYESVETGKAKLIPVPKDSRGPRLISAEPLENQWIQQGQMRALVELLESHPYTRGHVNFTDQTINGRLALSASKSGEWATLDMKEASDRVSVWLVKELFHSFHYEYLDASRSTHTVLPDGTQVELNMFAPMGSAVCFPIEALVFWSLCVATIMRTHNVSFDEARRSVYVYGDDIICRSEYHAAIRLALPKFGLKLNEDKCCVAGSFRESCGVDAFKGVDVTPTKISSTWSHRPNANQVASYVAYSNEFFAKGYYQMAWHLEDLVRASKLGKQVPYQRFQTDGVCFVRPGQNTQKLNRERGFKVRYNETYCRLEVKGLTLRASNLLVQDQSWEEMLYRWVSDESVFDWLLPPTLKRFSTLAQQMYRHLCDTFDRQHTLTVNTHHMSTSLVSKSRVGVYAVRHRNRSQCRWVPMT
jgi:hypothetical protein